MTYPVANKLNLTWAEETAHDAYILAAPYCPSVTGRSMLKTALCAGSHRQCVIGAGYVRPCRSMCKGFGAVCGIPEDVACMSVSVLTPFLSILCGLYQFIPFYYLVVV